MVAAHNNRGVALIGVLIALVFLMALAATMAVEVTMDTQQRGMYGQAVTGFYAAESGLDRGMGEFKDKFLNWQVPSGTDFNPRSSTLGQRAVSYQLSEQPGNPKTIQIPTGQLFAGLNSLEYDYLVKSTATNSNSNDLEASVGAEFLVGNIPLFQFVAFYTGDLEILPGQNMTLQGRVHTNGELYLNSESGITLSIQDNQAVGIMTVQVSSAGLIHRGRKDTSACTGTVSVDMLQDIVAPPNDLDPQTMSCVGASSAVIPVATLTTWKGSIIDQIQSISVPKPDVFSRPPILPSGVYWTNADLRIALKIGVPFSIGGVYSVPHTIEVQDSAGNTDVARTTTLRQFMGLGPVMAPVTADTMNFTGTAYVNGAPTSMNNAQLLGTRPIFVTDVPGAACGCTDAAPACAGNTTAACYPQVGAPTRSLGALAGVNPCNDNRSYTMNNYNVAPGNCGFPARPGMLNDYDYRRGGFYNQREKKWMYLLNVNIADLLQWNRFQPAGNRLFDNADVTDGGLVIYLSVVGPESALAANRYGVRIFGSTNLFFPTNPGAGVDPTGLTVVSDQAMYIQGNLNQGNNIAAPYGNAANPAGNLPKQPLAIMADSINVLSQGYFDNSQSLGNCGNDCQSNLSLADARRGAATTWINAGFIAGVDNTAVGAYNGGLENYPRFHEDWGGSTLNYWGSFVSLGTPLHVTGAWCGTGTGCNIYNPPARAYNYDPFFNNVANLPPLTPRFVYVQQVRFTEDFL